MAFDFTPENYELEVIVENYTKGYTALASCASNPGFSLKAEKGVA